MFYSLRALHRSTRGESGNYMNPKQQRELDDACKCKKQAVVTRNAAMRTCLLLLMLLCGISGAMGETYTFHDGVSMTSGIFRRHRDLDPDRRHYGEVHSSAAAVAKVKAQQRYMCSWLQLQDNSGAASLCL